MKCSVFLPLLLATVASAHGPHFGYSVHSLGHLGGYGLGHHVGLGLGHHAGLGLGHHGLIGHHGLGHVGHAGVHAHVGHDGYLAAAGCNGALCGPVHYVPHGVHKRSVVGHHGIVGHFGGIGHHGLGHHGIHGLGYAAPHGYGHGVDHEAAVPVAVGGYVANAGCNGDLCGPTHEVPGLIPAPHTIVQATDGAVSLTTGAGDSHHALHHGGHHGLVGHHGLGHLGYGLGLHAGLGLGHHGLGLGHHGVVYGR